MGGRSGSVGRGSDAREAGGGRGFATGGSQAGAPLHSVRYSCTLARASTHRCCLRNSWPRPSEATGELGGWAAAGSVPLSCGGVAWRCCMPLGCSR